MSTSFDPSSIDQPIAIICAADDNYSMPVAATLHSTLVNMKSKRNVNLYIIDAGISRRNKRKIAQSIPLTRASLNWLKPQKALSKNMPISQSITIASYYRLLIPSFLPSLTKAIYLDSDLIVRGNLEELWNLNIEDNYVLAAQDLGAPYVSSSRGLMNYQELGIPADYKYFNSGVLVINIKKWLEADISNKIFEYIAQNKEFIRWHDQDAMNAILAGQWGELDPRWNQLPHTFRYSSWQESSFQEDVYNTLIQDPYIVHFSTRDKPWKDNCTHPLKNLFFEHVNMQIWSGWVSQQEAKKKRNYFQRLMYDNYIRFKELIKRLVYRNSI